MAMPGPNCSNSQSNPSSPIGGPRFFAEVGENNWAPIARNLLVQLHCDFVVHLEIMKAILGLCAGITEALRSPELTLDRAQQIVFSLTKEMDPQTFQNKEEQWDQIWSNANAIIDYCGLQAPAVRHATRSRVGRAQQSTGSDDFRRLVYIQISLLSMKN